MRRPESRCSPNRWRRYGRKGKVACRRRARAAGCPCRSAAGTASERCSSEPRSRVRSSIGRPSPRSWAGTVRPSFPLAATLMGLARREFVKPERSAEGGERFRFSHALLRDAVYDQMAHRLRSQLHLRFADVLLATDGDPEVIAHHLERAHGERLVMGAADPETAVLAWRAGGALHLVGRRALARKEWQHAREVLERASALFADEPRSRGRGPGRPDAGIWRAGRLGLGCACPFGCIDCRAFSR